MFRYHVLLPYAVRDECEEYHPWTAELKRGLRYATFAYTDASPDLVLNSLAGVRWWRVGFSGHVEACNDPAARGLRFVFDWPSIVRDNGLELK